MTAPTYSHPSSHPSDPWSADTDIFSYLNFDAVGSSTMVNFTPSSRPKSDTTNIPVTRATDILSTIPALQPKLKPLAPLEPGMKKPPPILKAISKAPSQKSLNEGRQGDRTPSAYRRYSISAQHGYDKSKEIKELIRISIQNRLKNKLMMQDQPQNGRTSNKQSLEIRSKGRIEKKSPNKTKPGRRRPRIPEDTDKIFEGYDFPLDPEQLDVLIMDRQELCISPDASNYLIPATREAWWSPTQEDDNQMMFLVDHNSPIDSATSPSSIGSVSLCDDFPPKQYSRHHGLTDEDFERYFLEPTALAGLQF